ncbi:hypothetical protein TGGT1_264240, partial [Toxoplasma gondii GT1]
GRGCGFVPGSHVQLHLRHYCCACGNVCALLVSAGHCRLTRTHRPPCCWTCAAGSVCFSFGRHTHLKENSDGKARSSSACG